MPTIGGKNVGLETIGASGTSPTTNKQNTGQPYTPCQYPRPAQSRQAGGNFGDFATCGRPVPASGVGLWGTSALEMACFGDELLKHYFVACFNMVSGGTLLRFLKSARKIFQIAHFFVLESRRIGLQPPETVPMPSQRTRQSALPPAFRTIWKTGSASRRSA